MLGKDPAMKFSQANSFFFDHFGSWNLNTGFDQIRGIPLKNCPSDDSAIGAMPYPTIVFTYMIMGVVSLLFFVLIVANYNSVRVFNKKIRTNEISNTLWIMFYLFLGLRSIFDAVRYGMDVVGDMESNVNLGLYFSSLVTDAIIFLFLALSLNHQLRYRSTAKPAPQRQGSVKSVGKGRNGQDQNADDHKPCVQTLLAVLSVESVFFVLFILHLVFLYLNM